jgi:pyridoxal 5'-phosphate synthase pdxT subunit
VKPRVGVLALQGAFMAHSQVLIGLGAITAEVRTPTDLAGLDALIMPGGESTTMSKLLETSGLFDPLAARIAEGLPVFGTCAGMILLATRVLDGRRDQRSFGAIDLVVRRNGYGRQIDSFETDLDIDALTAAGQDKPFHAVFIRAPLVEQAGAPVTVMATYNEHPVLCRQGPVWAAAFHPELSDDPRLHALFLQEV